MAGATRPRCSPDLLAWLSVAVGLDEHARAVDASAGLGGAAAWATARAGARVVAVEPDPVVAALSARLFPDVAVVAAPARALPLADGCCTAGWALEGVDPGLGGAAALAELGRVVRPGGRVVVAALVAVGGATEEARRAGSARWTEAALLEAFATAGLAVRQHEDVGHMLQAPTSWLLVRSQVQRDLERAAAEGDSGLAEALRQRRAVERSVQDRLLILRVYVADAGGRPVRDGHVSSVRSAG